MPQSTHSDRTWWSDPGGGQFLESATGTLLDGVAVLLEIGVFRWAGGNVGEGVKHGVGAEFRSAICKNCGQVHG